MSRSLTNFRFILIVLSLKIVCFANKFRNNEHEELESITGIGFKKQASESNSLSRYELDSNGEKQSYSRSSSNGDFGPRENGSIHPRPYSKGDFDPRENGSRHPRPSSKGDFRHRESESRHPRPSSNFNGDFGLRESGSRHQKPSPREKKSHRHHRRFSIIFKILFMVLGLGLLICVVFIAVKIMNKYLRWRQRGGSHGNWFRRRFRRDHIESCACRCFSPYAASNCVNNVNMRREQQVVHPNPYANINNDYEIVNINTVSEQPTLRPEVTYPQLPQFNHISSTSNDFSTESNRRSNPTSFSIRGGEQAPQLSIPLLK